MDVRERKCPPGWRKYSRHKSDGLGCNSLLNSGMLIHVVCTQPDQFFIHEEHAMTAEAFPPDQLIDNDTRIRLTERFSAMPGEVELHSFVREKPFAASAAQGNAAEREVPQPPADAPGASGDHFSPEALAVAFCRELAGCSPHIRHVEHQGAYPPPAGVPDDKALSEEVNLFPTVIIRAAGMRTPLLRLTGSPLGEEARVLVQAILLLGGGDSGLTESSRKTLSELDKPLHIRVFTSPSCPYSCAGVQRLQGGGGATGFHQR